MDPLDPGGSCRWRIAPGAPHLGMGHSSSRLAPEVLLLRDLLPLQQLPGPGLGELPGVGEIISLPRYPPGLVSTLLWKSSGMVERLQPPSGSRWQ